MQEKTILTLLLCIGLLSQAFCQQYDMERSVLVKAVVRTEPPAIQLEWEKHADAQSYEVYRRQSENGTWDNPIANLESSQNKFIDNEVEPGIAYEYQVVRKGTRMDGYGYLLSGIEVLPEEQQGRAIVLVDRKFTKILKTELDQFRTDLEHEGWLVSMHPVTRRISADLVKKLIRSEYYKDPAKPNCVIILGHITVPYSGNINPDAHKDHKGAWPADTYYGDINGVWTDEELNTRKAKDQRNHNIPFDGKFDQSVIPSDLEVQVGRIDFFNLPVFKVQEAELIRDYLNRNHAFRTGTQSFRPAGIIENQFQSYSEGFAQNGWKNFSAFFGFDQVSEGDFVDELSAESFLWAYACGGGTYTSCGSIVNSGQFAKKNLNAAFYMLYGSYFGDWDTKDNLLRASIAKGGGLASIWAGRPNFQFHQMALGQNLGHCLMASQNNSGQYATSISHSRKVHTALMGDPTLRLFPVAPAIGFNAEPNGLHINLNWEASTDTNVEGYYLYRRDSEKNHFERITPQMIRKDEPLHFVDSCMHSGSYQYMVRAVKIEESGSGTFMNLSIGQSDRVEIISDFSLSADFDYFVRSRMVSFKNLSDNANEFHWDFGDGLSSTETVPKHPYTRGKKFEVTLSVDNGCRTAQISKEIDVSMNRAMPEDGFMGFNIYPNPRSEQLNIDVFTDKPQKLSVRIVNLEGKSLFEEVMATAKGSNELQVDIRTFPNGIFLVQVYDGDRSLGSKRFVHF